MRNQINDYLNVNRLSSKHQYGFKKKISTIDAKMYETEFIRKERDKNNLVTAAFLDLSKAFDSINHEILSIKPDNLGFDTSALKLIGSFLSDRVQSVVLNDIVSDNLSVCKRCSSGHCFRTSFVHFYINDMHEQVDNKTELIQYADDTVIFTSGDSIEKAKTSSQHVL